MVVVMDRALHLLALDGCARIEGDSLVVISQVRGVCSGLADHIHLDAVRQLQAVEVSDISHAYRGANSCAVIGWLIRDVRLLLDF